MGHDSKESLRSIAQSKFLDGLLNFQIKPGQLLSQREISQIINCSIPSVREALKILESKGIVKLVSFISKGLKIFFCKIFCSESFSITSKILPKTSMETE